MNDAGMTNEEAIEVLKNLKTMEHIPFLYFSQRLAVDVAIEALKQPEIIRCRDCEYYPGCESEIDDPDGYCSCAYPKIKR